MKMEHSRPRLCRDNEMEHSRPRLCRSNEMERSRPVRKPVDHRAELLS